MRLMANKTWRVSFVEVRENRAADGTVTHEPRVVRRSTVSAETVDQARIAAKKIGATVFANKPAVVTVGVDALTVTSRIR